MLLGALRLLLWVGLFAIALLVWALVLRIGG